MIRLLITIIFSEEEGEYSVWRGRNDEGIESTNEQNIKWKYNAWRKWISNTSMREILMKKAVMKKMIALLCGMCCMCLGVL